MLGSVECGVSSWDRFFYQSFTRLIIGRPDADGHGKHRVVHADGLTGDAIQQPLADDLPFLKLLHRHQGHKLFSAPSNQRTPLSLPQSTQMQPIDLLCGNDHQLKPLENGGLFYLSEPFPFCAIVC